MHMEIQKKMASGDHDEHSFERHKDHNIPPIKQYDAHFTSKMACDIKSLLLVCYYRNKYRMNYTKT